MSDAFYIKNMALITKMRKLVRGVMSRNILIIRRKIVTT